MTLSPMLERELRVAARQPGMYRLRWGAALIFALFTTAMLTTVSGLSAREQLEFLSEVALAGSLLAGPWLTADCLSREKREGTLGLLFLTDLRGYDVVLGKLGATSLKSAFALLALGPIMAVPMLEGGVTAGEFWRIELVLVGAMFFSLSAGLAVSALCRQAGQAAAGTMGVILLATALLPALGQFIEWAAGKSIPALFYWPSAAYALGQAVQPGYGFRPKEYWGSVAWLWGMGLGGLGLAAVCLPRVWQERTSPAMARWRRFSWTWAFGSPEARLRRRARQLTLNPFRWLARRDRAAGRIMVVLFAIGLPIWWGCARAAGLAAVPAAWDPYNYAADTAGILQLFWKCTVIREAGRRFREGRADGSLAMILGTPLTPREILAGQRAGVRARLVLFGWGVAALLAATAGILLRPNFHAASEDHLTETFLFADALLVAPDYAALVWLGMWLALEWPRRGFWLFGIAMVLIPSWVLDQVLYWSHFYDHHDSLADDGGTEWWSAPQNGVLVWAVCCLVWDLALVWLFRRHLQQRFRQMAGTVWASEPGGKASA